MNFVYASVPATIFPENVEGLKYEFITESSYKYSTIDYSYKIKETGTYRILEINKDRNTFLIEYYHEYFLTSFDGIEPIGMDVDFKNGTTRRMPFSKNRSFKFSVIREIDLFDGKVMSIKNEGSIPDNTTLVFKYSDSYEEQTVSLGYGIASVGYVPFPWVAVYDPIESDIHKISTSAGSFDCYKTYEEIEDNEGFYKSEIEWFYDKNSGLCINYRATSTPGSYSSSIGAEIYYFREYILKEIIIGRSWDSLIVYSSGSTNTESNLGENEIVWFKIKYEYDNTFFDEVKGSVSINNVFAEWNDQEERWEIAITSESEGEIEYRITAIEDNWFGVSEISDTENSPRIYWERTGIPGFSLFSILLSLVLVIHIIQYRLHVE